MTFIAPDIYHTPNFHLRSYRVGDGEALTEAVESSYDHLKTYMPWATPTQPVDVSEGLARRFRAQYLASSDFVIGVFHADGRLLGGCGYHLRHGPLETKTAEIGMWIRASEAGSGLGTEVLKALVEWGFTDWPWVRLVWRCHADNLASRRVAEKANFQLEGISRREHSTLFGRRDTANYAILCDARLQATSS